MKIQLIDENTIKVVLTKQDFQLRNIDIRRFKPGSSIYRQLVLEIMAQAAHELNFKSDNCRVVVEGHVTKPDEITLLITKSASDSPFASNDRLPSDGISDLTAEDVMDRLSAMMNCLADMSSSSDSKQKKVSEKKQDDAGNHIPGFPADIVIGFSDFEKMIAFLHEFPDAKNIASSLYEYNNAYFLVFKVYARNAKLAIRLRNFATEFDGTQLPDEIFVPHLQEYGVLVIKKGAVSTLLKKFSK